MMMMANLIGFVLGVEGAKHLMRQVFTTLAGECCGSLVILLLS